MPQMSPSLWTMILILTAINYLFVMSLIYFFNVKMNLVKKKKMIMSKMLLIKW